MFREQELGGLRKANICVCCGKSGDTVELHPDHFIPEVFERRPHNSIHPFRKVVRSPYNLFPLCQEDHRTVDGLKIAAFNGHKKSRNIDPPALFRFLRDYYPITDNPYYRSLQIEAMIRVNEQFIEIANQLKIYTGIPKRLIPRFKEAALVAQSFINQLYVLQQKDSLLTYKGESCYNTTNQASVALGFPELVRQQRS